MLKEKLVYRRWKDGRGLCKGLINAKLSTVDQIMVSDVSVERCKLLSQEIGVRTNGIIKKLFLLLISSY